MVRIKVLRWISDKEGLNESTDLVNGTFRVYDDPRSPSMAVKYSDNRVYVYTRIRHTDMWTVVGKYCDYEGVPPEVLKGVPPPEEYSDTWDPWLDLLAIQGSKAWEAFRAFEEANALSDFTWLTPDFKVRFRIHPKRHPALWEGWKDVWDE
jgi:hypothetical protein